MAIHTEALRPGTSSESSALTPEEIVQRMRDEVLPTPAGHGLRRFGDRPVVDGNGAGGTAAERRSAPTDDPRKRIEALRAGDRVCSCMAAGAACSCCGAATEASSCCSPANAARTHSITRRALERLAGRV